MVFKMFIFCHKKKIFTNSHEGNLIYSNKMYEKYFLKIAIFINTFT